MKSFVFDLRTRLVFGEGTLKDLGALAGELGLTRTLLVADPGLVQAGHAERAMGILAEAGVAATLFQDFEADPDSAMVERGRRFAEPLGIDSIVGLGGGSSLDCAKGINFLLTNGGEMKDYRGYGHAQRPMLPMIGIPTTAGTGSEAQSYAVISDSETHLKMAFGDPKAAFRVAILDPDLTLSQPAQVTAVSGFDAIAHAVETYVSKKRTPLSACFSREAWRLLEANYERVLSHPEDAAARGAMQLGAYFSGCAIENSMVGAAHACANPLSARYGTTHGVAIALLLPHVVRWNQPVSGNCYDELLNLSGQNSSKSRVTSLSRRLEQLIVCGNLPVGLREVGVRESDLSVMAEEAARHWTSQFNPRPLDVSGALEVYQCAF